MTHAEQRGPARPERLARRRSGGLRSGKSALALALLLVVAAGAVLWQLVGEPRRSPRPDAGTSPAPSSPEPEPVMVLPPERRDVSTLPTPPERKEPCRLVVQLLAPEKSARSDEPAPAFTGTAHVRAREVAGAFDLVSAFTAADPRVELECPPGEYVFTLERYGPEALGALPIRAALEPGAQETVTLLLAPLHALTGTLTNEGRQDLAGVRVALERRRETLAETRTSSGGAFELAPLPLDEYELVVGDPAGPLVPRRSVSLESWRAGMTVVVPVLLELEVRVVDAQGRAVPGARVEGLGKDGGHVLGTTAKDGILRAAQLPPGSYLLVASHATLGYGEGSVELAAAIEQLEIHVRIETEDTDEDDAEEN